MTAGLLLRNVESNIWPFLVLALFIWVIALSQREVLWREAYRRIRKNKIAVCAAIVLVAFTSVAFLDCVSWQPSKSAPVATMLDLIFQRKLERTYSAPLGAITTGEVNEHPLAEKHLLGTDGVGADTLYQVLKGVRTTFFIGGLSCVIATPIALVLGMIAGYFGKVTDDIVQYVYTVFGSVPDILLIIGTVMMLGRSLVPICIALAVTSWIGLCRLVRGETLKHRDREYVRAAKALGASDARILVKHILPNLLPAVIIAVTLLFSTLALYETILSYLGVGVPLDTGSWGEMINASRTELTRDPAIWWNLVFSAGALLLLVLSLNVLADALRDSIDSRLRTE
jgi:peptide/nickel transport system permease protein